MSASDAIEKLWRRMLLVVGRGRITTGNDAGMVQTQQVKIGELETRDNTKRVAEYGFTSMPLPGCHAVVIFVGGDRSNGVIIGTNDQNHRLKNLQPGEAAIYTDLGQWFWMKRTGIEIDGGGLPINVTNTPTVSVTATDIELAGNVAITGGTFTHNGSNVGATHKHGGVTAGGANTGGPV
ncbi:MAG: phage baseplate assembly protein [Variovorax sp.]|nr:phage baseplate assembly protein [Variovorax sp.]